MAQNGPKRVAQGAQRAATALKVHAMRPKYATKRWKPGPRTPQRVLGLFWAVSGLFWARLTPFGGGGGGEPPLVGAAAARSPKAGFGKATCGGGHPPSFGPGPEPEPAPGKFCFCDVLVACSLLLVACCLFLRWGEKCSNISLGQTDKGANTPQFLSSTAVFAEFLS